MSGADACEDSVKLLSPPEGVVLSLPEVEVLSCEEVLGCEDSLDTCEEDSTSEEEGADELDEG